MDSTLVARYLSNAKYSYQDQTKRDVNSVLNQYRGLKPTLEKCTLPTGVRRELLCLKGTIPVTYRQNTYHIPVSLWILNNHPYSAPICWVNPTKDMTIKVSRHVDETGRIFLPYLSDWNPETSDLLGVIQVMIILFGETPPLYSKPKGGNTAAESASSNKAYSTTTSNPTPPYPIHYPAPGQYGGPPYPNVYPPLMPTATTSGAPDVVPPPAPLNTVAGYPPVSYTNQYASVLQPNYPPVSSSTTSGSNTDTITKEHIRISMLSAVEDKVRARSKEIVSQYTAEIEVLKKTGDELNKGRTRLENLVKNMETNLVELSKCKEKIAAKDAKITDCMAKLENIQPNIDEVFGPIQPLYKQLLNAFVEENSIIDAIFYLHQALQKGVIDLDVFIKQIRELSRRQFMTRALIRLCREKAGLPT